MEGFCVILFILQVDDTLSVFLEYVSGGSIYKLLREYGPFSEPIIQSYAAQILSGLAYLHGRDTVHRFSSIYLIHVKKKNLIQSLFIYLLPWKI